eukprot:6463796-Amphidinium_carterae.1
MNYAPAALRTQLCLAQIRQHKVYLSDIASAFLNTPVQERTKILQPPPECENNEDVLGLLQKQLYGLRDSPQKFQQHLSTILPQLVLTQLRTDQCVHYRTNY